MPNKVKVYDKGDPTAPKEHPEPARVIEMMEIDAKEAVARGRGRYSLTKPAGFGAAPPPVRGRVKTPEPVADQVEPNE